MAASERSVLQNPLLRLLTKPQTGGVTGRSKDAKQIVDSVFRANQIRLLAQIRGLASSPATSRAAKAGRALIWAEMMPGSEATSHTPDDLFSGAGAAIVFAWKHGYVVDIELTSIPSLIQHLERPTTAQRCDIYRVANIELFALVLAEFGGASASWDKAKPEADGAKRFLFTLPVFSNLEASRAAEADYLRVLPQPPLTLDVANPTEGRTTRLATLVGAPSPTALSKVRRALPHPIVLVGAVSDVSEFYDLIESGTVVRWEPVAQLVPTIPGEGTEPPEQLPELAGNPIVGIVDGGYHGNRYKGAIAWTHEPPLVNPLSTARSHGNKVVSITVDGHLWSNNLQLPSLFCRVGIVQAIPGRGSTETKTPAELVAHLEAAMEAHPDTLVWNLSANTDDDCDDFDVSELGHQLSELARRKGRLLVISAGNTRGGSYRVSPPADCEAAIVVGGRLPNLVGAPGGACDISRRGLGPEGMLKPDTSWFTRHRVAGGEIAKGTSFAAPLVAKVAAHTWQHLDDPSPDVVKALVLNACDLDEYDETMGFGAPVLFPEPWNCPRNVAVVSWRASLSARRRYYWTGIRAPESMIRSGRFVGRAKMVAVLEPTVQRRGHHYISNRVEASLQIPAANGKSNRPIIGCLNPRERELQARSVDHKWDPVRVYSGRFTDRNGPKLLGGQPSLQVYARLFWRNAFQYTDAFMLSQESNVTFVVTLEADDPDADTYNEFRRVMAEAVESAVVETNVEVQAE